MRISSGGGDVLVFVSPDTGMSVRVEGAAGQAVSGSKGASLQKLRLYYAQMGVYLLFVSTVVSSMHGIP